MKELISAQDWNKQWQEFRAANAGPSAKKMDQAEFWNQRAESFAQNTIKSKDRARTEQVFKFLKYHGALNNGYSVLDIGSGPGSFTIPLAELGNQVLAMDPSPRMLELCRAMISPELTDKIELYEGLWEEIEPASLGWVKTFDLVFASMCPGVNELALIEKMMVCSRQWCYISAFAGPRCFEVYDEIFRALTGLPYPNHFNDIIYPFNLVYALGYRPSIQFLQSSFTQKERVDLFISELYKLLPNKPSPADETLIQSIIARHTHDDEVHQLVSSSVGMMVWQVE